MECSKENAYKHFWSKVQGVVGVVPTTIQRTLELQGYAASSGLGDITAAYIQEMEESMKLCAANYKKLHPTNKH